MIHVVLSPLRIVMSYQPLPDSYEGSPGSLPPRRFGWRSWVYWSFLALLLLMLLQRLPSEVSYWYVAAAQIAAEEKDLDKALRLTEQALRWAPQDKVAHEARATVLLLADRPEEALTSIDEALAGNPRREIAYILLFQRSLIHKQNRRYEEALRDYDAAAAIAPNIRRPFARVELLILADRRTEALAALEAEASESSPTVWERISSAERDNSIAYFLAVLNSDLDRALEHAEKAVQATGGKEPGILDTRGFVHYRRGEFDEALVDLAEAVKLGDTTVFSGDISKPSLENYFARRSIAVLRYHKGLTLAALERESEAAAEFARVRELGFEPAEDLF